MKRANTNGWKSLDNLAEEFLVVKGDKKAATTEYDSIKATIINKMEGQPMVETDRYIIQYVNNPRQVIDVERLKTERPEMYLKYLSPQDCWNLNVNAKRKATA